MAYAVKYTISFQSVGGTNYTVNILQDGFSGTAKRLQASDKPFTINEDNSEDYFSPIRSQSGYLRIINKATDLDGNPFDYKELIATNAQSHQVQLMSGNNIVWLGYIKPVVLTNTLFGYCNVVEIPIQCPLAVLKTTNLSFDTTTGTFLTMGQIIHMLFSKLANITWGNLYLTANISHKDQLNNSWPFPDLNSSVSMFNFMENNNPEMASGSTYLNYTATWEDETPCAEVLEKICRFWGWCLYTRGADIYLVAPGTIHDYYQIAFSSLASQLGSASPTEADDPTDIEDLTYMSTKHSEEYLQGYRKVNIEADVNAEDVVYRPELEDLDYNTSPSVNTYTKDGKRTKSYQSWLNNPEQNRRLFLHNGRIFINHPDYPAMPGPINIVGQYDNWEVGATDDVEDLQKMSVKNSFDLKQDIVVYCRPGTAPADPTTEQELAAQTYFSMATLHEVTIPENSQLCLFGGAMLTLNPYQGKLSADDYVRFYIRIGNMYFGGNVNWTNQVAISRMSFCEHNEVLTTRAIYSPQTLNALYPTAKGFIIPVPTKMTGILEIGFLNYPRLRVDADHDNAPLNFNISDFNVRCVCQDNTVYPINKSTQKYSGVASVMFQNDLDVGLSLASGTENTYGKGQLYASRNNGERFGGCAYNPSGTGWKLPEQYLLQNMQRVYGQLRHRMSIEVAENAIHANPLSRFTYNNKNYIMQCVSHDYVNDKMELTIIEE